MAIITLTSDFGTKDFVAGAVKGCLASKQPLSIIHDISHEVSATNYTEAFYIISSSVFHFPKNSYHLLLVNLFNSVDALPLFAYHQGHYFGVADNGLLPMVLNGLPEHVIQLPIASNKKYDVLEWVKTFAKAIDAIESGQSLHKLGIEPDSIERQTHLQPFIDDKVLEGRIIFIDKFGNVVTNITRPIFEQAAKGRKFKIDFQRHKTIQQISPGYAHQAAGDSLAFFNSAGYLEIAVNKGNAATLFGFVSIENNMNTELMKRRMFYFTVKIEFSDT